MTACVPALQGWTAAGCCVVTLPPACLLACLPPLPPLNQCVQGLQDRLAEERADLSPLARRDPAAALPLEPGGAYRLAPAAFMDQWRAYMSQAGKRKLGSASKADQVGQQGAGRWLQGERTSGARAAGNGQGGGASLQCEPQPIPTPTASQNPTLTPTLLPVSAAGGAAAQSG